MKKKESQNLKETEVKSQYSYVAFTILGAIILTLVAGFLFNQYLIGPTSKLNTEIVQKEKELTELKKEQEILDVLKNDTNLKLDAQKIAVAFPTEKQIPELITQLENIAIDSGLAFKSIKPVEETEKTAISGTYQTLNLEVNILGKFENLKTYFNQIEKNVRLIEVTSLDLKKISEKTQDNTLNIILRLKTYYAQ